MRETQRMAGFVAHYPVEFGVERSHRERFEVHGRLVGRNAENVRSQIGPVAGDLWRRRCASDAYLGIGLGLRKLDVRCLCPGIHVSDDASAKVRRRVVEKADRQAYAGSVPALCNHDGDALEL